MVVSSEKIKVGDLVQVRYCEDGSWFGIVIDVRQYAIFKIYWFRRGFQSEFGFFNNRYSNLIKIS